MSGQEKIKVIIVDDSAVFRGFWGKLISAEPDMEIVTTAADGVSAISVVKQYDVDVLLLDIEMPRMTGLEALPFILKEKPSVKVVIASSLTTVGSKAAIEALSLGASDFIAKPNGLQQSQLLEMLLKTLLRKLGLWALGDLAVSIRRRLRPNPPLLQKELSSQRGQSF